LLLLIVLLPSLNSPSEGDAAFSLIVQVAGDFGIPAELIQALWDLVVGGQASVTSSESHGLRVDIIDWAIQLLTELGLEAVGQLLQFLPPELVSMLVELVLGVGLKAP
jgi:hypothetical protein